MRKRLVIFILSAALAALCLSACGGIKDSVTDALTEALTDKPSGDASSEASPQEDAGNAGPPETQSTVSGGTSPSETETAAQGIGATAAVSDGFAIPPSVQWLLDGQYSFDFTFEIEASGVWADGGGGGRLIVDMEVDSIAFINNGTQTEGQFFGWGITEIGGQRYLVDYANKRIMAASDDYVGFLSIIKTDYFDMEFVGAGTGNCNGRTLPCIEFIDTPTDATVRFYLDENVLYGIETDASDFINLLLVSNVTNEVATEVFDLTDYVYADDWDEYGPDPNDRDGDTGDGAGGDASDGADFEQRNPEFVYHSVTKDEGLEFINNTDSAVRLQTTNRNRYEYVMYNQQGSQTGAQSDSGGDIYLSAGARVTVSAVDEDNPVEFYFSAETDITVRSLDGDISEYHTVTKSAGLEFTNNTTKAVRLRATNNNSFEYRTYNPQGTQGSSSRSARGTLYLNGGSRAVVFALDDDNPVAFYFGAETDISVSAASGSANLYHTATKSAPLEFVNNTSRSVTIRNANQNKFEYRAYNQQGRQLGGSYSNAHSFSISAGSRVVVAALDDSAPAEFYFGAEVDITVKAAGGPPNVYHTVTTGGLTFTNNTSSTIIINNTNRNRFELTVTQRNGRVLAARTAYVSFSLAAGSTAFITAIEANSPAVFYFGAETDITVK